MTTRFVGGPADRRTLLLERAPLYLRVCLNGSKIDALDALDDEPQPGETVTVYRKLSDDGTVHLDYTEKGRRKGKWFSSATYTVLEAQPGDEVTRTNTGWREWCASQSKEKGRPMSTTEAPDLDAIATALSAPFDANEVKFKPATVSGNWALALPYVDARVIQDRLDDVLGVVNWQDKYDVLADGNVVCALSLRIGGDWITKMDVGGESGQPDEGDRRKASFSDALKRAAVKFGIGRYLYRQKPQWVDYDPQKKQFTRQPVLPQAGQTATSTQTKQPAVSQPAAVEAKAELTTREKLKARDAELAQAGLCRAGDLIKHVWAALKPVHGDDADAWDSQAWAGAIESAKAFIAGKRGLIDDQIWGLLECKGETPEALAAKLGAAKGTRPEALTHAQASRAVALLMPLPDKMAQKRA
jgi:hypothetical protein